MICCMCNSLVVVSSNSCWSPQVTAYSDGQVKVYELLDSLELDKWQLQVYLFFVHKLASPCLPLNSATVI